MQMLKLGFIRCFQDFEYIYHRMKENTGVYRGKYFVHCIKVHYFPCHNLHTVSIRGKTEDQVYDPQ